MNNYTPLLIRQIKKFFKGGNIQKELVPFIEAVNRSYEYYERDHTLATRSLELSSSELQQMNAELAKKEEIFRQFEENSDDLFYMLNSDLTETIFMSPNRDKIFDSITQFIPNSLMQWQECVHPEDRTYFLECLKSVAKQLPSLEIEYRIYIPGYPVLWLRNHIFQVKDESGVVYRIGGIARNVTAFKIITARKEVRHILGRIFEETNTLLELFKKTLEAICKFFGFKIGIVWEILAQQSKIRYFVSWFDNKQLIPFDKNCQELNFSQEYTSIQFILEQTQAVLVKEICSKPYFNRKATAQEAGLQSLLGFPIYVNGQIYAVIEFYHASLELEIADFELFNDLAKQLGFFIDRRLSEQALIASEERFRNAFEHGAIGMALLSLDGKFLQCNPSLSEMLGFSQELMQHKNLKDVTYIDDLVKEFAYHKKLLSGELSSFLTEKRFITSSKDTIWTLTSTSLIKDNEGHPLYFVYEVQDISQRKYTEEKLFHLAYYDLLTSLPNRRLVEDTLNHSILTSSLLNTKIAVFLIKINRFSYIKDLKGTETTDRIFKQLALRLNDRIVAKDIVGRWDENEFALISSQAKTNESAILMAQKILALIKEPCFVDLHKFYITASIGIAMFPDDADNTLALCKNAAIAMNSANKEGKDNFSFFTEEMYLLTQEKMEIETHLRKAIQNNELLVFFQPIIDVGIGRITGVESLIRWHSRELGKVNPGKFIPLAEEAGLIISIGEWVLRETCYAIKALEVDGFPKIVFDVNVSMLQLKDPNFIGTVRCIIEETQVDPRLLRFEIVESQLAENIKEAIEVIDNLKKLNIEVAIDDFGIGYSSFSYLKQFNVDRFKIDMSFIRNIHNDAKNAGIVSAIQTMSETLGIKTIAEGVEQKEELDVLKKLNCQEIQGYYFSQAIDLNSLKNYLNDFSINPKKK